MNISFVRLIGILLVFFGVNMVSLAEGGLASADHHVVSCHSSPINSRHPTPGGEVTLAANQLTASEDRVMVLTFDDGPVERDLDIVALLKTHNVSATFFYIGYKMKAMPGIVQRVIAAEHEVGYHSYRHQRLSCSSEASLKEDLKLGGDVANGLGVAVKWFRPPFGAFNDRVVQAAKAQGMQTILWSVDSRDWTGISAATMARSVIRQFHPGAVLLFHSKHETTLKALPEVLAAAEKERYRFVSLREWQRTVLAANCRAKRGGCSSTPSGTGGVISAAFPKEPSDAVAGGVVSATLPKEPSDVVAGGVVSAVASKEPAVLTSLPTTMGAFTPLPMAKGTPMTVDPILQ
ncbi:MAG: polysaccharide deacetylase family protein [Magnetococcales bacterium]|nr:polysaccharide deacetylase family protein [Magnetococcales bacterium]